MEAHLSKTVQLAHEAGLIKTVDCCGVPDKFCGQDEWKGNLKAFEALVRADERMSFYGQDKPAECADGCPPNQICDYCQVVAPAKAMILAEREACAKVCDDLHPGLATNRAAELIRARGNL